MKQHGVRRVVVASVAGIPAPGDNRGALAGVIGGTIKLFMRDAYADREQQTGLVARQRPGLDCRSPAAPDR